VVDGPLELEGILEVNDLLDECDAPVGDFQWSAASAASDIDPRSARVVKGYCFDLARRGGHAVLAPEKSRACFVRLDAAEASVSTRARTGGPLSTS
jgi:hypothetical protein